MRQNDLEDKVRARWPEIFDNAPKPQRKGARWNDLALLPLIPIFIIGYRLNSDNLGGFLVVFILWTAFVGGLWANISRKQDKLYVLYTDWFFSWLGTVVLGYILFSTFFFGNGKL